MAMTAIYARISDDRQDGAGVERQLEDCRQLCHERNYGEAQEFVDNAFSASVYATKPRPQYQRLLKLAKAKQISRIVVYNLDRLYRQPRELEDVIDLTTVEVVSLHGDLDLTSGDGKFAARIYVSMAAKTSDDTSRRVKRRNQQAREKGLPTGGKRAFGWLNGMTPHPTEAPLVAQAIEDITRGVSLTDIAKRWNRAGVPQVIGKSGWHFTMVKLVVTNPRHAGIVSHGGVEHGPAQWPAIVDQQTFRACVATIEARKRQLIPPRRSLLTGLIYCGLCGQPMTRFSRVAGKFGYRCTKRPELDITSTACGRISISARLVENVVTEATFAAISDLVIERPSGRSDEHVATLRNLELIASDIEAKYASGKIDSARFDRLILANDREQATIRTALAQALTSTASAEAIEPFAGKSGVLRKAWPTLTTDQQRAIIAIGVRRITIHSATPGVPVSTRRIVLG